MFMLTNHWPVCFVTIRQPEWPIQKAVVVGAVDGPAHTLTLDGEGVTTSDNGLLSFEKIRRATEKLPETPSRKHEIDVLVEQSPGQGFARVTISSQSYTPFRQAPLVLDWQRMEEVDGVDEYHSWPNVAAVPGHPVFWHPDYARTPLIQQLKDYLARPLFREGSVDGGAVQVLEALGDCLAKPAIPPALAERMGLSRDDTKGTRPLGTDGSVPSAHPPNLPVPGDAGPALDAALGKASDELETLIAGRPDGTKERIVRHLVFFSTWCFHKCPPPTTQILLDIYAKKRNTSVNTTLLGEGLGRATHQPGQIKELLSLISRTLRIRGDLKKYELAALARVLGGCETAYEALTPDMASDFCDTALQLLKEETKAAKTVDGYKTKFRTTLFMLTTLLRHRIVDPGFLDPGSRTGQSALEVLQETSRRIRSILDENGHTHHVDLHKDMTAGKDVRRLSLNANYLSDVQDFILRRGRNPDIIVGMQEDLDG